MSTAIDRLFDEASQLPETEREMWLHQHGGDDALVAQVLRLLQADARAASFLESPPVEAMLGASEQLAEELKGGRLERVGPYIIDKLLGSGGMGEVYLARRETGEFEQRVAIKLLRGCPTRELVGRFARERRVLASLGHPNIAALIDGGETVGGTPYLVMPYVEGKPIDEYCRSEARTAIDVVELMLPVLDAVSHAHRRLVVHRDLKPANVIVDGEGRPMVLDFGIAKILSEAESDVTRTGRQLLTPMYASPEQLRDGSITTSADIFSLGVMLYELLSGVHPWSEGSPAPVELARRICEREPPSLWNARSSGSTEARQSQRALWTDLDAVVLTAIRKEPDRRYASVDRFAEDLRAALEGRAVTARPDTIVYRASRLIRRHRVATSAAAVAVVALIAGAVVSSWQASRAEAASLRYRDQLTMTERRNEQLRDLATTLIFDVYDSVATLDGANPAKVTLIESGVTYLDELATQLDDDPGLAIELIQAYTRLADVQGLRTVGSLGRTADALESSDKALAVAERLQAMPTAPADAPVLIAIAQRARGDLLKATGHFDDALLAYSEGLDAVDTVHAKFAGMPRVHRYTISLALQRGSLERRMGLVDEALLSYERAMSSIRLVLAAEPEHMDTRRNLAIALRRKGDLLLSEGRIAEAEPMFIEGRDIFASMIAANPQNRQHRTSIAIQYERLGDCALRLGQPLRAREHFQESHRIVREVSEHNPNDVVVMGQLSIGWEKLADASSATGDIGLAADQVRRAAELTAGLAERDPDNRAAQLDALFIRGKAARMAMDAGRDGHDELVQVATQARLLSLVAERDVYPASIEIEALVRLAQTKAEYRQQLLDALTRHRRHFEQESWFVDAESAAGQLSVN